LAKRHKTMRRSWKSFAFRVVVLVWALAVRVTSGRLPSGVHVNRGAHVSPPPRLRRLYRLWWQWPPKSQMLRKPEPREMRESVN